MAVELKTLFNQQRIPVGREALVAIYFPFGFILLLLRIFIGLHVFIVSCLLPKFSTIRRIVMRVMCGILGIFVTSEGLEERDPNTHILVANHVSVLDHTAVKFLLPCVVPNVWQLPRMLSWALGYEDKGAQDGRQMFIQRVKQYCAETKNAVLTFPEGAMTSGCVGLLKYSTWPFSVEQSVQPILIRATRPLLSSNLCVETSSLWSDILWFLFVPFTHFHVRVMPVMTREEAQSPEDFTVQVQNAMAQELNIASTKFSSQDKIEYLKRKTINRRQDSSGRSSSLSTPSNSTPPTPPPSPVQQEPPKFNFAKSWSQRDELDIMVRQVKDVLPNFDNEVIRKDLEVTKSVDATITNILEGRISTQAAEPASGSSPNTDAKQTSPSAIKFAASQFGKSSSERQTSLEKRKAALLASAKRHYMEKKD